MSHLRPATYDKSGRPLMSWVIIMCAVLLSACSHFQEHDHGHTQQGHHTSVADDTHQESITLQLNGEKKWLMDQHTRKVFAEMYSKTQGIKPEALSTSERRDLGEALEQDLDKLIQGCTMQGAAHDALHQYLSELIPAVAALKTEGEQAQAEHVQQLLSTYQDYFE